MENWKPIKGTNNRYSVSNEGRVRDNMTKRLIFIGPNEKGIPVVAITINKELRVCQVRHLVADAFLGEKKEGTRTWTISDDRSDCRLENITRVERKCT